MLNSALKLERGGDFFTVELVNAVLADHDLKSLFLAAARGKLGEKAASGEVLCSSLRV